MIIWIVVASSGKKKGKKTQGKAAGPAGRSPRGTERTKAAKAPKIPLFEKEAGTKSKASYGEGDDPCHEDMLRAPYPSSVRYEETAQSAFETAAEGEDPCHPGERQRQETHVHAAKAAEEDAAGVQVRSPAQEDLLRAVVMSEVLKRPAQRREERHSRRLHKAAYAGTKRQNCAAEPE